MKATLHTNHGDINLTLFPDHAPKTVKNFVGLARHGRDWQQAGPDDEPSGKGFYDGLIFHRVIPGFMIQGGCPDATGMGGPGYTFNDEISPDKDFQRPYMLAMANAGIRMGKGTNGSQFFITVGPTPWLQGKHTIFGEVADAGSRAVVDKIAACKTAAMDRPEEDVVIERVTIS